MSGFRFIAFRESNPQRRSIPFSPTSMVKYTVETVCLDNIQVDTAFNETTPNDNILSGNDSFLVVLEGWLGNDKALKAQWTVNDVKSVLTAAADTNKLHETVNSFRGEFGGIVFNKKERQVFGFTDHTSIHTHFYYLDEKVFICSTHLQYITEALKELGISYALDEFGAYSMLTYGFMLESTTLIKGIHKLKLGTFFTFDIEHWKVSTDAYYRIKNDPVCKLPYNEVLEELHERFQNAVKLGIDKDREAGKTSMFHLSDGLDCRTTVLAAETLSCRDKLILNYAHSASTDYLYPQDIIKTVSGVMFQMPINDGGFLTRHLDDWFNATGGNIHYSPGGSPLLEVLPSINWDGVGIQHNGYAGDAVLGSFLKKQFHSEVDYKSGAMSDNFLFDRITKKCLDNVKIYANHEQFKWYTRAAHCATFGPMLHRQTTFSSSPFLDPDFFDFALSIPPKLRYGHRLRVDLINKYYTFAKKTRWGRNGLSISTSAYLAEHFPSIFKYSILAMSAYRKALLLTGRGGYSLIPEVYWWNTNRTLRDWFGSTFKENLDVLSPYHELKRDCELLYRDNASNVSFYQRPSQRFNNKILAVSLVYAARKYFG
jgi:asparagine synthase (glutamine-hydrolysing)